MENRDPSGEMQAYLLDHQAELLSFIIQFDEQMSRYEAAIKEICTKLEILKADFRIHKNRDCISTIQSRIKSPASILDKLARKGCPIDFNTMGNNLDDIAGIRVICKFIDDIYVLAEKISSQDDLVVVEVIDYIKNPKPNGYRSYHMVVEVPVFFATAKEYVRVEIQLRTVAMDFWASLEHDIRYKKDSCECEDIVEDLKVCADTVAVADKHMMELRDKVLQKHQQRLQDGWELLP